jgi:hexokinase
LQNDTIKTLVNGYLINPDTTQGVIASTGFNIGYFHTWERARNRKKVESVNIELGAHPAIREILTAIDKKLDAESSNPGVHLFEKLLSSKYMAAQLRLMVRELMDQGLFPKDSQGKIPYNNFLFRVLTF